MKMEHFRKAALAGVWTAFFLIVFWVAGIVRVHWAQPGLANAILYPPASRALPEFSLLDSNQDVFDKKRLTGKWSFLFFGYTRCPDVCPLTLQTLRLAAEKIRGNGGQDVRFVFVSVDPARDRPYLKDYVSWFSPDFLGVTGEDAQLSLLTSDLGAPYRRVRPESAPRKSYFMDHSARIYLISPDAQLYAMLPPPHDAAIIAADFHTILEHFSKTRAPAMKDRGSGLVAIVSALWR